jgi:hypothetical protein
MLPFTGLTRASIQSLYSTPRRYDPLKGLEVANTQGVTISMGFAVSQVEFGLADRPNPHFL